MILGATLLEWVLGHLGPVIFVVILVSQIVRGFTRAQRGRPKLDAKPNELEQQRRTQEVQEQIRRRIAERRRAQPAPSTLHQPETAARPEAPGGTLRRVMEELQRELTPPEPAQASTPPPLVAAAAEHQHRVAEVGRQQQLVEQMKALEEARMTAQRRATHLAAAQAAEAETETSLRAGARTRLLEELRTPENLRRAFVLREVLGTPVGLR